MYHGDVVPGFPQHPHRGFETVTYVRKGLIDHSDSLGATARFGRGDVQWLTAGGGIVHSEMFPLVDRDGPNPVELFQIWLNLPAARKMDDPYFTMIWADDIPKVEIVDDAGHRVVLTVIAGAVDGRHAAPAAAELVGLDRPSPTSPSGTSPSSRARRGRSHRPPGPTPSARSTSSTASRCRSAARQRPRPRHRLGAALRRARHRRRPTRGAEALVLQGRPIGEPVAQQGPFVMNDEAGLRQTFLDYQRTGFGGWPWPARRPGARRRRGPLRPPPRRPRRAGRRHHRLIRARLPRHAGRTAAVRLGAGEARGRRARRRACGGPWRPWPGRRRCGPARRRRGRARQPRARPHVASSAPSRRAQVGAPVEGRGSIQATAEVGGGVAGGEVAEVDDADEPAVAHHEVAGVQVAVDPHGRARATAGCAGRVAHAAAHRRPGRRRRAARSRCGLEPLDPVGEGHAPERVAGRVVGSRPVQQGDEEPGERRPPSLRSSTAGRSPTSSGLAVDPPHDRPRQRVAAAPASPALTGTGTSSGSRGSEHRAATAAPTRPARPRARRRGRRTARSSPRRNTSLSQPPATAAQRPDEVGVLVGDERADQRRRRSGPPPRASVPVPRRNGRHGDRTRPRPARGAGAALRSRPSGAAGAAGGSATGVPPWRR